MTQPRSRILIVDDEENVAVTMQAVLEMDGHDVEYVTSGAEGLARIAERTYDLVLTDLRLEDIDGTQILAELRRRAPDTIGIVLTGYASMDSAVKALREGAYDYLLKPCDVEELRATIERGLERRRLGQQLRQRVRDLESANEEIQRLNADLQRRVDEATVELRQSLEKLEELDRLKSQFMSIASHELKTPITAMSGFLQVVTRRVERRIQQGIPDKETWQTEQRNVVEQLDIVKRQTGKLARLIDELLDVSRIQNGRMEFQMSDVDMVALAREVADRMRLTTQKHELRVNGSSALVVIGDRDHIEQVLNNLVSNAIKYSPDGGPVEVELASENDGVLLRVRDVGIGIPKEELGSVFGLFYRSPDRAARDVGGMGLGLFISKQIVDRHGGRIWVESEPGKGSTFHVWLPREPSPDPATGWQEGEPATATA